jgi:hypothetical protein
MCCDKMGRSKAAKTQGFTLLSSTATESVQVTSPLQRIEKAVLSRFPVLKCLRFSDDPHCPAANLPLFVGLIAAIAESSPKPCCVILPEVAGVPIAVGSLLAVNRLRSELPELLRAHASVTFRKGVDNVLVYPAGLVYRYDGFFTPEFFKLGILDRKDSRSLPVRDIARLEKTTRRRPKGALTSDLGRSEQSVLSSLLDLRTNLNRNVLRNRVLLLGSRKALTEELTSWIIEIIADGKVIRAPLQDEIPFGKVTDAGKLTLLDGYVAEGEPLVAIASRASDLAGCCETCDRMSKSVVVSDVAHLLRDLRACDSIADNQHTVVLATDAERDSALLLEERGFEIWRLTTDEVLLGMPSQVQTHGALVGLVTKASRVRNLVISEICCSQENLDLAAEELQEASHAVRNADNSSVRELFYSLFGLLMQCAEYVGQNKDRFVETTNKAMLRAKEQLRTAYVWLTPDSRTKVENALEQTRLAIGRLADEHVNPKEAAVLEALKHGSGGQSESAVLVVRSGVEDIRHWLDRLGFVDVPVYSIDDIPEDRIFGRILVLSWPRSTRFDELVHRYVTTDLRMVSYSFEGKWLKQYQKGHMRSRLQEISSRKKFQMVGISTGSEPDAAEEAVQSKEVVSFDIPEERFLARRKRSGRLDGGESEQEVLVEAWYVGFVGSTFANLTEGHELAVLNGYVSGQAVGSKVPMRSVDELSTGDYVLFRESGDSDIIRFIAEDEIGKEKYQRLRTEATRWRKALTSLGDDPRKVWDQLRAVGFDRHLMTVKSWMYDENRICPKDIEDVRKIAEAARDRELLDALTQVEQAKEELMSLHISAGFRLTQLLMRELPGKMGTLAKAETELDLGVGKVWIVRIEEIDRSPSQQRRSQVNRLLWDEQA